MARCEDAISADEADRAFERLRDFPHLVLAVSGGPDSLALLALIAEWRSRLLAAAPSITVATVDHKLRDASQLEARTVADVSAQLGLAHVTLEWIGDKPTTGIPDAARNARYALLGDYARSRSFNEPIAVVTAHHQDDQAETFLMRLMRGGGVTALAAMPRERRLSHDTQVTLVRPLLEFSKSRLIATLTRRGISWFDDPSNENAVFERVRARQALAAADLSAAALATSARRMRDAADGLQFAVAAFARSAELVIDRGIYARFDRPAFDDGPIILRQLLVEQLLARFGGTTRKPELSELESLAQRFTQQAPFTTTLGGAVVSAGSRYVRVWREPTRIDATPVVLHAGSPVAWDDRFTVGFDGVASDDGAAVTVQPLGELVVNLPVLATKDIPRAALAGLPAFYAEGTLLGVPILTGANGLQELASGRRLTAMAMPQTGTKKPPSGC